MSKLSYNCLECTIFLCTAICSHLFFYIVAIQMEERKQQKKDKEKTTEEEGNVELDPEENTGVDQTDVDSEMTRGERMEEDDGETVDDVVDGCDNDTGDRCTDGQTDECGT